MKNHINRVSLVILSLVFLTSCATIVNSDIVLVPVETTPPQAKLVVNSQQYFSPATVLVPRGKGRFILHIEKEGYNPVDITFKQSINGWVWGNILFGGPIGLAIDFVTGRAYDIDPKEISVALHAIDASYHK